MKVLSGDPLDWSLPDGGSAITIGVYDGVHRGHQRVLVDLETEGEAVGVRRRVVLTFDRHPLSVVAPEKAPRLLMTMQRRLATLESLGVDVTGVLPFEQVRHLQPEEFVTKVLVGALRAKLVVVGTNFRFGENRRGDVDTLRTVGARMGMAVDAVDLLQGDHTTLSSSAIRGMLLRGDIAQATAALGHPFVLDGTVSGGDGRGRDLGFPTANLDIPEELLVPANGVYAVWATADGTTHPAVLNIGVRPTFGGTDRIVEAHLLDVSKVLYGRSMSISFVERIRDERRFSGPDHLVDQIRRDVETARAILGSRGQR